MSAYYFSKTLDTSFDAAIEKVTAALKEEEFGVLTEIDVKKTLKEKIDVEFRPYRILGACSPPFAHRALAAEDKIGTLLPCNVIVQELPDGIEVAAVDPKASMMGVDNPALDEIAEEIQKRLRRVIDSL